MNDLNTRFDLTKLTALVEDETAQTVTLAPATLELCLDLLSRWPFERWMWLDDGDIISDARWDEALNLVDTACAELIPDG